MESYHVPVLFAESIDLLNIRSGGVYVDLTFGGGGHSRGILERLSAKGRLLGFDQDSDARRNVPDDARFTFIESNFRFMRGQLRLHGYEQVDGVLADLGVSSHHFDTRQRGFSFRFDAPLDMRMNQRARLSAADVVNRYETGKLIRIFRDYGELDAPHRIAGCIERVRRERPLASISDLIEAVAPVTPRGADSKFLAKLFQAIRIEVNGEMEALPRYTPEQLSILLRIAAGKLGRDPVKLQEELQNGRLDGLLQSLGADREKVNALLSDREGLSQLLQSPQVRMLLQQLLAGQAPPEP